MITTTPRCILKAKWCQFDDIDSDEDNDDEELEEIDMFLENDVTKYTAEANIGYFFNCDSLHPRLNSHYEVWS